MSEPLRFSTLKWMARSPAHAKFVLDHPEALPDTPAMRFGRLAHAIFLGGEPPIVFEGERRGNRWKDFKIEHDGRDIVTAEEFERASEMAAQLHWHKEARQLLLGARERTVLWDFAGRKCRGTPDVRSNGDLTDLKTTQDASPSRFPWIAMRLSYHAQLAWYRDGMEFSGGAIPEQLSIVAIETKPPFAVCVFQLTDRAVDFGRRLYRTWLEEFLSCEKSGVWPGYEPGVLDAPEDALELVGTDGELLEVAD